MTHVARIFNLRRNEVGPASLLFGYLFLVIGAYIMGQSIGDAMFLNAFPNHLPHVIIATALVVGVFVAVYIRISHRVRLELMIIGALFFFALSFVLLWWLTRFGSRSVYPLIYFAVYLMGAMGPTMGWTLANYALTTREARRVFGFIGAGSILGAPCAGFVTADLIRHGYHPESLLLVIAVCLAGCAVLVKFLFSYSQQRMAGTDLPSMPGQEQAKNFREIWAVIYSSRYLLLITALIAIGCMSTRIISYQFQIIAKNSFGANKAGMAAFFGSFNGYLGMAAFLVQMLFTGRILRSLGIRVSLFILPFMFVGGSVGVLLVPTLLSACILKGSHNLLRFSLDQSSRELLYLPVAPPHIKSQIKSFIDGFIWRSADGVAGIVLLFFANKLHFSPSRVSLVNLVFLFGWIAVAYGVRREYLNVLRNAIERRTLDPDRINAGVLDSTTTEVLAQALEHGGEQQVLYGLSLLEVSREPGWHPVLRRLLEHSSPVVRNRALQLLNHAGDRDILPQVEKMLGDSSPEVRSEALRYVAVHTGRDPLDLLSGVSDYPGYFVKGLVFAYLAGTGEPEYFTTAQFILHAMISETGPEATRSRAEAAQMLGVIPAPCDLHSELLGLLRDQEPIVLEQALLSAGKIQSLEFLPVIIENLGQPRHRVAARSALAQYGEGALDKLRDSLNDDNVPLSVRKQIPDVLAHFASTEAAAVLADSLIQSDPGLRFDLLKALNKVRRRAPALVPASAHFVDILNAELTGYYRSLQILAALEPRAILSRRSSGGDSLLTRALRERMDHEFERIFRLLALLYPPRDVYNAFVGLTTGRPQLQANALELLEHLLKPEHYRMLACAIDPEIIPQERLNFAQRLCRTSVGSITEALRTLLGSNDRWLCACALHTIGESRLAELSDDLRKVRYEVDPVVEETWKWASTRLAAARSA